MIVQWRRFPRDQHDELSRVNTRLTWFIVLTLSLWMVVGLGCGGDDGGSIDPSTPPVAMQPEAPMTPTPSMPPPTPVPLPGPAASNVVINEVFPEASLIELHNPDSTPAEIGGYWLCHTNPALVYDQIPDNTIIDAGGFLIVHWGTTGINTEKELFTTPAAPLPLNKPHGEVGLYTAFGFDEGNFGVSEFLQDYVQWGEDGHWRERVAAEANVWPAGAFVPTPSPEQSLSFDGNGDAPEDWDVTAPTIGSANAIP